MNQLLPTTKPAETALRKLRRQEISAKLVPFITFILTHLALVVLLFTSFFTVSQTVKILLAIVAVLCILGEMFYISLVAINWRRNVSALLDIQEKQRKAEEAARLKEKEDALALEQHRNNVLLNERQRRQQQPGIGRAPISNPLPPQQDFAAYTSNAPQQAGAIPPFPAQTPRRPFPQAQPNPNNTPQKGFPSFNNNGNGANQYATQLSTSTPPEVYSSLPNQGMAFPQVPDSTPRRPLTPAPGQTSQPTFPRYSNNGQQGFPQYPSNGAQPGFQQLQASDPQKTPRPNEGNNPNPQYRSRSAFDQHS
ncbi:MAG TPA: hypothetical protein VFN23_21230 [Ktedonobacteraceae bacterium]|nr:hypothetical protein [Ktedonobacteraceae bacterium]